MGDSNPTDELRAKLDELGVKYTIAEDAGGTQHVWWSDGEKEVCAIDSGRMSDELAVYHLTPEQAIAATVGAGTCRNIAELNREGLSGYFFVCSECGLAVHANLGIRETNYPRSKPDGSTDLRTFNSNGKYEFERCPRCGRKVTK